MDKQTNKQSFREIASLWLKRIFAAFHPYCFPNRFLYLLLFYSMLAHWIYIWPCQNWVYMYSICHNSRHDINSGKRRYGATFHQLAGGINLIPLFIWFTPIMSVKFGGAVGWFNLIAIIPEQMNSPNSTRITGWKRGWNSLKKLIWGKSEKRSVHVACTPGTQLAKAACPTAKLRAPDTLYFQAWAYVFLLSMGNCTSFCIWLRSKVPS